MKNKLIIYLMGIGTLLSLSSCDDWLNLYPEDAQTSDQYWETKEDVEAVIGAGYVRLRDCVEYMYVWGEARGNGVSVYNISKDETKAFSKLQQLDILTDNMYAKWEKFYKVINIANSVLRYAPTVLENDPSFTTGEMNSFFSEAYFQRALAYFYLVRTFRDVPLILEPYVKDEGNYEGPKSSEREVLSQIVADLNKALPAAKEVFTEEDEDNPVRTKGRATKWSIYALLADIYLWQEEYDKCIDACDAVINSRRVGLIANWFANYYPGNSNESIFEIQYDYYKDQRNSFTTWFGTNPYYRTSVFSQFLFQSTKTAGDTRGDGSSYIASSAIAPIWKYQGVQVDLTGAAVRTSSQNDQNYIIYRLAEIYLMKAEALIMKGGNDNLHEASQLIFDVRKRGGIVSDGFDRETVLYANSEIDMLLFLLYEKGREFLSEGKSWFDILRIGRKDDYAYKELMIQMVLQSASAGSAAIVRSKLTDVDSHYLPIHQDEINSNKLLEQNPYYRTLGN